MKPMAPKATPWSVACTLYGSAGGSLGSFRPKTRSLNLGEEVARDTRPHGWWMSSDEAKIGIVRKQECLALGNRTTEYPSEYQVSQPLSRRLFCLDHVGSRLIRDLPRFQEIRDQAQATFCRRSPLIAASETDEDICLYVKNVVQSDGSFPVLGSSLCSLDCTRPSNELHRRCPACIQPVSSLYKSQDQAHDEKQQ